MGRAGSGDTTMTSRHDASNLPPFAVVHANTGDWVGIYKDGKLVGQGHSFFEHDLLQLLGLPGEVIHDADVEATGWSLPDDLADVVGGTREPL
jgi:hypothetical protein